VSERPAWLKVKLQDWGAFSRTEEVVALHGLHTVCHSAHCPNIAECWGSGTATLMLLGNVCTRSCGFCAVKSGRPKAFDPDEPRRVARAVRDLGLRFAVLTSVARDDLPDGGAWVFAESIREIRRVNPETCVEVLVPDFRGVRDHLYEVLAARPDVLNHNLETVKRLQKRVRPSAGYDRSLEVLRRSANAGLATKSGLMLGLGETTAEVHEALEDLREAGAELLTIGQYLAPDDDHLPVERYVPPEEFEALRRFALSRGFARVAAGPLVRSSYHAEAMLARTGGRAP